jgi:hypothetical protein
MSSAIKRAIKKSVDMGLTNEEKYFPYLCKLIDIDLKKTLNRYDTIDFESEVSLVELKSRNCYSFDYPTAMIGYNKIERALEETKKCYFVFAYTNGLYVWDFDKNDKCYVVRKGGRKDIPNCIKDYAFIPSEKLRCIKSFCLVNF